MILRGCEWGQPTGEKWWKYNWLPTQEEKTQLPTTDIVQHYPDICIQK